MRRSLLATLVVLAALLGALGAQQIASASFVGPHRALLVAPVQPYDPFPAANTSAKFKSNDCKTLGVTVACSSYLTTTATTARYMQDVGAYGLWSSVAAGSPRINARGLWSEGNTTQAVAVASVRNLATGWTLTGLTAAKDQVGITGGANTASSVTLTAASGTATLAVTQTGTRSQSAFIKIISCAATCTVEQSLDTAGIGYVMQNASNCFDGDHVGTALNTTGFLRCQLPTASQTNKTAGFRFTGTIGDKFAIDFVNNTNKTFVTAIMDIATQTAETLPVTDSSGMAFTNNAVYLKYSRMEAAGAGQLGVIAAFRQNASPATDRMFIEFGSQVLERSDDTAAIASTNTYRNFTNNMLAYPATYKNAFTATANGTCSAWSPNLGTPLTCATAASPTGALTLVLGSNNGGQVCYCVIEEFASVPAAASKGQLLGYTNFNFLLRRDLVPAANDNTPAFLNRVAANDNTPAFLAAAA